MIRKVSGYFDLFFHTCSSIIIRSSDFDNNNIQSKSFE